MSEDIFNAELYREFNESEFDKVDFSFEDFPIIFGKILVTMFAKSGRLKIGKNVTINSAFEANPVGGTRTVFLYKGDNALIEVGDNTGISNAMIAAYEHVYIGSNVNIGAGSKIFDTDFHSLDLQERIDNVNIPHKPVRIEDGVFIGTDAMILKGVTIGEEAIIAAGAVVAKSVPAGEIWGGNPAKFIKKLK